MINAEKAMIVWTPNREPFLQNDSRGKISVTTIPEPHELRIHPLSVGACDAGWVDMGIDGRRNAMKALFKQMITNDGMDEAVVRQAFKQIDEFASFPF